MMDFCILGSGIAGSTIANLLSKKYSVEIFDKARGPGGRASNKKFNSDLYFDHGAQYINPKTKKFKNFVQNLYEKNILNKWDGNHLDFTFKKKEDSSKFIGKKANNDICKYYLKNIKQNYLSHINKINRKKDYWEITLKNKKKYQFKAIILTCPYPQLIKLASRYLTKKIINLKVKMEPNITLMIAFKNYKYVPIKSIKFNDDVLAWAANENSKKRFFSKTQLWTLQSTVKWAKKKINFCKKDKKVEQELKTKFLKLTGFQNKNIIYTKIHGWKYSYNFESTKGNKSYWDFKNCLGIAGDWLIGPGVEDAWSSAINLKAKIKKNPL